MGRRFIQKKVKNNSLNNNAEYVRDKKNSVLRIPH